MGEIDILKRLQQLKEHCKQVDETNKILYQEKCDLIKENEKLKDTIKEMEDDLDDWISDVSILYIYDDRQPNNLVELLCCMEHAHEEWSKYKQCLNEIEEIAKNGVKDDCGMPLDELSIILKLIKQAKEGE